MGIHADPQTEVHGYATLDENGLVNAVHLPAAGGSFSGVLSGATADTVVLTVKVDGDTGHRLQVHADGSLHFGDGTVALAAVARFGDFLRVSSDAVGGDPDNFVQIGRGGVTMVSADAELGPALSIGLASDSGTDRLDVTHKAELDFGDGTSPTTGVRNGTGAPSDADGVDGEFYLRSDGGALTTIYQKRAGAWVGIV